MKVCIIGLGYVGLPLAVAFKENNVEVIGFDTNIKKIEMYNLGIDMTKEVGDERLKKSNLTVTCDLEDIRDYNIYIIAVPTPITKDNRPDLTALEKSSDLVGKVLKKGDTVIFESTVYPGVTENFCGKILQNSSNLKMGVDFKLGYSPERINPGDNLHRLETITKVVSGQDQETLKTVTNVYERIILPSAGVFQASSIKVAEAAKVIENSQRDINIAFMNELSMIFDLLEINTEDVLAAANTKWNFLDFRPGLVGGHCIGVDPFYLTFCAEKLGYHSQVILAGRTINDSMAKVIANKVVEKLSLKDKPLNKTKVAICGLTFKENCPDTRNSKVINLIRELEKYHISVVLNDDIADKYELEHEYGITELENFDDINNVDAFIFAVNHETYKNINLDILKTKFVDENLILFDLKWIFKEEDIVDFDYWKM